MAKDVLAKVTWQEKVRFVGQGTGDQSIVIDYPPPFGDDAGIRGGLELLLMSLTACAGQGVVILLGRMRQPIKGCTVSARGKRRDEHPTILTDIELAFTFEGEGLDLAVLEQAVDLAEKQYCPVWAMLKNGTRITTSVEIAASPAPTR